MWSCEVIVLDAPACWRPTAQQPPTCTMVEVNPGVFLNGVSTSYVKMVSSSHSMLAARPSTLCYHRLMWNALPKMTELDGCLCVYHVVVYCSGVMYHIQMLRNYKERKWEKLGRVDPRSWTEPKWVQPGSYSIARLDMYKSDNRQRKVMFGTSSYMVFALPRAHTQ